MNTHEERILEIKEEIMAMTRPDIDEFGTEIRVPRYGKKRAVEAAELRLRQAIEANEAYGRAQMLLR